MQYDFSNVPNKKNVLILQEVRLYFYELAVILYRNGYFSYYDSAVRYVYDLIIDIQTNLPYKVKRPAPPFFKKYGENLEYSSFSKSRRTVWFAFFERYEENGEVYFLVKHVENNHTASKYM
jgi:hypothetical protein